MEIYMKKKLIYEPLSIDITLLGPADIITTSGAFEAEDDLIDKW